jgi:diguanylate cyclase (GGDEF)-like protein/PAS domain S-box-containing protein
MIMDERMLLIILLLASSAGMVLLALFGWRRRRAVPAARAFSALMLAVALYCGGYAVEISCDTIPGMLVGTRIEYLGISFLPAFWLLLALYYCGVTQLIPRILLSLLFVIPVMTLVIVSNDGLLHLHYRTVGIASSGIFPVLDFTRGPWYWVHTVFSNLAILAGNALLLGMVFRSERHFRLQSAVMFVGSLLPWSAFIVHLAGAVPGGLDPIPFALATSGPIYAYGLFRFRLFDLAPIVRSTLVENLQDGMLVFNHDWRLVDLNHAAVPLLSVSQQEAIGALRDRVVADYPGLIAAIVAGGGLVEDKGNGRKRPPLVAQISVTPIEGSWRKDAGFLVLIHDIAELKKVESDLRDSEEKFRLLFEAAPEPILLMDDSCRFIDCNSAAVRIFGVSSRGNVLHRNLAYFSPEYQPDGMSSSQKTENIMRQAFAEGKALSEWVFRHRDGSLIIVDLSVAIISIKGIKVQLIHLRDITEKKQVEQKLQEISLIDDLTGLHNRRGFMTLALQQIKIADRLAQGMTVFYADLDDLKVINDTYGHQQGDQALIDAAGILKASLRASDILARIGGDEFVGLILESGGETEIAVRVRVQENLNAHNLQRIRPYRLSLSFGTARYSVTEPCSIEDLLEMADRDMYRYKLEKKTQQPG